MVLHVMKINCFSRFLAALTRMQGIYYLQLYQYSGALGHVVAHGHSLAIQISLLIESFPRKTNRPRHSVHSHVSPRAAVAALLNQSCLLLLLQGTRDPLFLTGVTFPSEYPIYEETKIKLTVYDVKDKSHDTVST